MQFGKRIYELRKLNNITQEQLSSELGVSVAAVSKWENNNSMPDIMMLCSIADFFKVTTDELLGRNKKASFVIADDAQFICDTLEDLLEKSNYTCISKVGDGKQLIEAVREFQPNGVFCDIHMPVMDGLYALKEIKKIDSRIKVFIVTGDLSEDTKNKAIESGADGYITKPFLPECIYSTLKLNEF